MSATLHNIVFALLIMCSVFSARAQPSVASGAIVTREGLSLYTFDNDVAGSGKSVCNAPCSGVFPPYLVGSEVGPNSAFTWLTRDDGSKQWAYKGRPLYRFYADEKPGDTAGDGLNRNLWHIARP